LLLLKETFWGSTVIEAKLTLVEKRILPDIGNTRWDYEISSAPKG